LTTRVSRIYRLILIALAFVALMGAQQALISAASDASGWNAQAAIPTNTPRPTHPAAPATNTPRPSPTETPTLSPVPTQTVPPTDTPVPPSIGPVNYPDDINSLTGLPYPDDAARNRRNLIVKVSNYTWVVRPQSGLSQADIVYEYEVEGGVTRFAAIYRSQAPDHVGSIRSGRLLDLELVIAYDGLLAYSGSNDPIKNMIINGSCIKPDTGSRIPCTDDPKLIHAQTWRYQAITPQFGNNCPPFCRYPRPGLAFEHTLFANTQQIWDVATKYGVNTPHKVKGLAFNTIPDASGKAASDIALKWFHDQDARWQYNADDGLYYRWNTGIPHIDSNTGAQLTADNVVVLQAPHLNRPDVYESEAGSPAVEVQLWGEGPAWVFRDGLWFEGVWQRNHDKGGLYLYYPDRKTPIDLKPGNSWFEVVRPNMYGVTVLPNNIDVHGTETPAVLTATARAPVFSAPQLTQEQAIATRTQAVSAATNAYTPVATITAPAP
jgi:hypothetical protein